MTNEKIEEEEIEEEIEEEADECRYCAGNCPNEPSNSIYVCDGFDGDIDGLYEGGNNEESVVIRRELKFATFEYDETEKTITIETRLDDSDKEIPLYPVNGRIKLNAVYSFALLRFVIRIAQRNWFRKLKK